MGFSFRGAPPPAGRHRAAHEWRCWVDPATDPPARFAIAGAAAGFANAANVEAAPDSADLIGRRWIANIP